MLDEGPGEGLPSLMDTIGAEFCQCLANSAGAEELPAPALPYQNSAILWRNNIFRASGFRRGHVELFSAPRQFAVLHLCIFPHTNDPASIFGFDMIAGRDIATGVFLDYSGPPGVEPEPSLRNLLSPAERESFLKPRQLPPWGSIFSHSMLAIRPVTVAEIDRVVAIARRALNYYVRALAAPGRVETSSAAAIQNNYVSAQRQNEHTFKMLARFVGPQHARAFIDDVLFPYPGQDHELSLRTLAQANFATCSSSSRAPVSDC